ncbi:hypothetical protein E2C01_052147 [Portunus trituberculatus]|uniref:Uncharacterized protein n=1 Tax=Portunus trituberculatus TaxID=210409 RepID=A0A5B7GGS8_PORTR|nr:hypothetical protein [Portunus trituberculatus]
MDCTPNPASTSCHTRFSTSASRVPAARSSRHPHAVLPAAAAVPPSAPVPSFSSRSVAPAATPLASSDRPSAARTGLSDTFCPAPSSSSSPEECQNDGFTLRSPSPPPSAARPSVGVSRAQRSQANFPTFRVPPQEGFGTSYDVVAALKEDYSHLHMQNIIGRDGSTVLLPQDEDTCKTLQAIASEKGAFLDITELSFTRQPAHEAHYYGGRVRQVQWVQDQQRAAITPASPGTFVWGQQRSIPDNTSPQLTQQDFPPLLPTASQLPSSQRPSQSPNGPNRLAPTQPPAPPRDSIPVTKDLLRNYAKELSLAMGQLFSSITGATFDLQAFNRAADVVSSKIAEKLIRQAEELTVPAPRHQCNQFPLPE